MTLFRAFWGMLIGFLRVWVEATVADAEDSVSNLLLNLYQRALDGRFILTPYDWEAYVTRAALNQYRRDARERYRATPTADVEPADDPDSVLHRVALRGVEPSEEAAGDEGVDRIRTWAAEHLSEIERRALFMRVEKQTCRDVAEVLGTTANSVSASASRAREKLATWLGIKRQRGKAA